MINWFCLMCLGLLLSCGSNKDSTEQAGVTVETENVVRAEVQTSEGNAAALARVVFTEEVEGRLDSFATGSQITGRTDEEGRFSVALSNQKSYFFQIEVGNEVAREVFWQRRVTADSAETNLGGFSTGRASQLRIYGKAGTKVGIFESPLLEVLNDSGYAEFSHIPPGEYDITTDCTGQIEVYMTNQKLGAGIYEMRIDDKTITKVALDTLPTSTEVLAELKKQMILDICTPHYLLDDCLAIKATFGECVYGQDPTGTDESINEACWTVANDSINALGE